MKMTISPNSSKCMAKTHIHFLLCFSTEVQFKEVCFTRHNFQIKQAFCIYKTTGIWGPEHVNF